MGPLYSTFVATLAVHTGTRISGRFAPTPSGPMHQGSLVAALGSYLAAKSSGGRWQIRIDDIDQARVVRGADAQILSTLEAHGLAWDGPVVYQSARLEAYRDALNALIRDGSAYRCTCTRRTISATAIMGTSGPVYPGTCRTMLSSDGSKHSWRADMRGPTFTFLDLALGPVSINPEQSTGDVIVWRADDVPSYHLSCVVDEAFMCISQVVRGIDLLGSTACQIRLCHLMGLPEPEYGHLPLVFGPDGRKLAKRHGASSLLSQDAASNIRGACRYLGLLPPPELESVAELLEWATSSFDWPSVQRRLSEDPRTRQFTEARASDAAVRAR